MTASARHRREEIVRLAASAGLAEVADLADRFAVSASTIRRDLAQLETAGRLARTYGGAMAGPQVHAAEPSLRQRIGEAFEEKHALARWCADQVQMGENVMLDAGSTVAALAHELRGRPGLVVTTTSLGVLDELRSAEDVEIRCLGGTLRPVSQAFVGPVTEAALDRMTFDRVFLGADSVDAERGICEADLQQARLKELMAERARQVYVLAHAVKLGRRPFHAWARLRQGWTLVTSSPAPGRSGALDAFRNNGVDVVVVDPERTD